MIIQLQRNAIKIPSKLSFLTDHRRILTADEQNICTVQYSEPVSYKTISIFNGLGSSFLESAIRIYSVKKCFQFFNCKKGTLKVVGNEKGGGGHTRRWQMRGIGLGLRRARFVCLLSLLQSSILCISVSAPVKQNEQAMS